MQGVGDREQVLLVGRVVLVGRLGASGHETEAAGGYRGQEGLQVRPPFQCRRQVGDVPGDHRVTPVGDGADADERRRGHHRPAYHGPAEVLRVVLRERPDLGAPQFRTGARPGLEPGQPLGDVGEEARLSLLSVGDHVDAMGDLLADGRVHCPGDGTV